MKKIMILFAVAALAATACSDRATETMTVASKRAECHGVAPMQCLLVKLHGENDWTLFYNTIEGFDYVPGYEYVIRVRKTTIDNPPADGSSLRYELDKVVSSTEKQSEGIERFIPR